MRPDRAWVRLGPNLLDLRPDKWALCRYRHKAHWSGGRSRLDRDLTGRFGSAAYAQEELRAELASVFIGAETGLPCDIPNHANYVASWARNLKQDKRESAP